MIVNTSKKTDSNDGEWQVNGAGHQVNNKFGFGALDTAGLVNLATDRNWKTAGEQHVCKEPGSTTPHYIPKSGTLTVTLESNGCAKKPNCVTSLEHVRVYITLDHDRRGAVTITLISPSGTKSELLKERRQDYSNKGFQNWPFMTVFSWGENPRGKWTLKVTDHGGYRGTLKKWSIRLYGSCEEANRPNITKSEKQTCKNVCKKGCPLEFATSCKNCSQYCHCDTGKCVRYCDEDDEIDETLKHCLPPNSFTKLEKKICQKNCQKPCPKAKFCDCHTGQCISSCGHDDKVDAKTRHCLTPNASYNKGHLDDYGLVGMSTFHKWLIVFSLLAVLLVVVLVMYMFKAKEQFCWARPAKNSPQRNVSYRPVSLENIEPPVKIVPPEQQGLVQSNA